MTSRLGTGNRKHFLQCVNFPTAARLSCIRDGPDDPGGVREVPGARPQEVRGREARLLGQPQVSTVTQLSILYNFSLLQ